MAEKSTRIRNQAYWNDPNKQHPAGNRKTRRTNASIARHQASSKDKTQAKLIKKQKIKAGKLKANKN